MTIRILLAAAVITAAGVAVQQPGVDVSQLGPQTGARVVDFTLRDQRGAARSIRSMAGPKGTMLVFFRSADW